MSKPPEWEDDETPEDDDDENGQAPEVPAEPAARPAEQPTAWATRPPERAQPSEAASASPPSAASQLQKPSETRELLLETSVIPEGNQFQTGVVGPVGSGKTYLFQALMHRLQQSGRQGVLTRFIKRDGVDLWQKIIRHSQLQGRSLSSTAIDYTKAYRWRLTDFNRMYQRWERLNPTRVDEFARYTLLLKYNTGWVGSNETSMKLTFIDCSGEVLQAPPGSNPLSDEAWRAFEEARVMIFCLPIWAAFPGRHNDMNAQSWDLRDGMLHSFSLILDNYKQMRGEYAQKHRRKVKTRVVLALTHADDSRSALRAVADKWIGEYVKHDRKYLARLGQMSGPTAYLAAAREMSAYLRGEFARVQTDNVSYIPDQLTFDGNAPWIIPVTAVDGSVLSGATPRPGNPPVPAHVELPLLLALCEAHNALM